MKIEVLVPWELGGAVGHSSRVMKTFTNGKTFYKWQEENEPNLSPGRVLINDLVVYGWDEIECEIGY